MNQDQLFKSTRWRLACWYAGVMSIILGGCSLGVYSAIAHAHQVTIKREIASIASSFRDNLKLYLKQPGKIDQEVKELFPSLCSVNTDCSSNQNPDTIRESQQLDAVNRGDYYLRLLDLSGQLVAVAGRQPQVLPAIAPKIEKISKSPVETDVTDQQGIKYHQISLILETTDNQQWGYLLVGRSLQDFNRYVANVAWILSLGFPIALVLVTISAWYLAGLAMQPIYRSYQQIQQFTGDAAHELRTPLATIRATIESVLLSPVWQEQEIKESIEAIERQNSRMSNLVADLLTLARMERENYQFSPIILNDLINDLGEEFSALAVANQIELVTEIRVTQPVKVEGNESQLYRLVSNLVINAIQYTPKGGRVTIVLATENRHAIIQVKDTGIGIPEVEQSHIFERFYRLNSDRSRQTGGAGLGLAIASAIVQRHKGSITVKSELNQGSTFTIWLP
ncbi:MAG: two-component system sensor histidine kinase RppB [Waterburya sp.]